MVFFMEFITTGLAYISGVRKGYGAGWVVTKVKTNKKRTQIVEFRMAMMYTCTHKGPIFRYKA